MLWHKAIGAGGLGGNPIEFVGAHSTSTAVNDTSFTYTYGGNLTGGTSSSAQEGDLVFVAIGGSTTSSRTYSNSSGFTKVGDFYVNGAGDVAMGIFYKIMGSTPDTSVSLTANSSVFANFQAYVFKNTDPSSPLDVTQTTASAVSGVPTPASITPVTDGAAVFVLGGFAGSGSLGSVSHPDLQDFNTNGTAFFKFASGVYLYDWSSGSVSPTSYNSVSNVTSSFAATFAIRPT